MMNVIRQSLFKLKLTSTRMLSVAQMSSGSSAGAIDLTGIYPPIATPFAQDRPNFIAYDKLQQNLEKWNKISFRGYVVQGSNGEYAFLNNDERVQLIGKVREMIPKDKLIIAGSGCESTRGTIEMTKNMAAAGADAALVVTPFYFKSRMTDSALKEHFTQVADQSPIPVILYSVPANTGLDLAPSVIVELADHPNIVGLKDSGGDITKIGSVIYATENKGFQVLAGSASFLYTSLNMGAVGGVCALANVLGDECCELQSLAQSGKHDEARRLQQKLIGPNSGITKQFGVPGLKTAMEWFGYYGGPVRSPLQPLSPQEQATLRKVFSKENFLRD